jgi:xanthine/uracil permease
MDLKTISELLATVSTVLSQAGTPAVIAVLLSIVGTQAAKVLANKWFRQEAEEPGMHAMEVRILSFVLTVLAFALACWFLKVPFRGENAGLGIAAGVLSPLFVWLAAKVGLDLDSLTGTGGK